LNRAMRPCGIVKNITGMVIGSDNTSIQAATGYSPPVMQALWESKNLTSAFANLAESITIEMRKNSDDHPTLSGSLGTLETHLNVRWPWITLPVFCACVSLFFLVISIWEAHMDETPLWKSSSMATLYHGLDGNVRKTLEHCELPSHMSREAEEVKVHLSKDSDNSEYAGSVLAVLTPPDILLRQDGLPTHLHGPSKVKK